SAETGGDTADATSAPGSLVAVSMQSTVGVLLDDFPAASRDRIAQNLIARPQAFWIERARHQLRLTTLRLIYRDAFYEEDSGKDSLPLPPESNWDITLDAGGASRVTIDGHDLVAVNYTFRGTLLSDEDSPGTTEPALAAIGGTWEEPF